MTAPTQPAPPPGPANRSPAPRVDPATWDAARARAEERAAILEFCAGASRATAERLAGLTGATGSSGPRPAPPAHRPSPRPRP